MKKLPLGIQNIREIIEDGYVYIDKTKYIYNLINNRKYYFLSRPRRFGKSLLLDTVGEVFKGEKELFKGLWIYESGYDFKKHPVIRLDMSSIANETSDILKESLLSRFKTMYAAEGFELEDRIVSDAFAGLIMLLHDKCGQKVVVLIDEYDKPMLDHIDNIVEAETNRRVMRSFYGVLKSMDAYLRFTMITGVSKFVKTSIFSELNNLLDITMMEEYANICGITVEDFDRHFGEHVEHLATLDSFAHYGNVRDQILRWYDGYSWDGKTRVLNPFSLLSFFSQKRFGSFWYASGTPKFLIDLIKKDPDTYANIQDIEITEYMLDSAELDRLEIESLLFQTGYLTVKEVIPTPGAPAYLLEMPNLEVREAFSLHIISVLTESGDVKAGRAHMEIGKALKTGDMQRILDILRSLFASIPYDIHVDCEAYYHSIFYAVMSALGFDVRAEVTVSRGRMDAKLEIDDKVYVIEFKYSKCQQGASEEEKRKLFELMLKKGMEQIKDRGYHSKYIGSGKIIYLAAFAFLGRDEIDMEYETIPPA